MKPNHLENHVLANDKVSYFEILGWYTLTSELKNIKVEFVKK